MGLKTRHFGHPRGHHHRFHRQAVAGDFSVLHGVLAGGKAHALVGQVGNGAGKGLSMGPDGPLQQKV